jgi:hypothetical protein
LRELAIMQVICPTCQIVSEKPQAVTPVVRLLCMGLFSIFLVGGLAEARPECLGRISPLTSHIGLIEPGP